jgi:hypothetical protein
MPDPPKRPSIEKTSLAVLKGGPEFQAWFQQLQTLTRLSAALLLSAALVTYATSLVFVTLPRR